MFARFDIIARTCWSSNNVSARSYLSCEVMNPTTIPRGRKHCGRQLLAYFKIFSNIQYPWESQTLTNSLGTEQFGDRPALEASVTRDAF